MNKNIWRKRYFVFNNTEELWRFYLLFKDMWHPWSKYCTDRIYLWEDNKYYDYNPGDELVRKMMDQGFVWHKKGCIVLLTNDELNEILDTLKFEKEEIYKRRYVYKYVSNKGLA